MPKNHGELVKKESMNYTKKQGQYLAFIYYYTKLNKIAPAEKDIQNYFGVSAPSVHSMVIKLDENNLIERTPGKGRSIKLLLKRKDLPDLD